jgi:hypothetical protein
MTDDRKTPETPVNQGEGNREAAREYNEQTREFVRSGKVEDAARQAGEQDPEEARQSEREGLEHAKEEDPEVSRDYGQPVDTTKGGP